MSANPHSDPRRDCIHKWGFGRGALTDEQYLEQFRARFWAKVDKSPGQGPKGECWTWTGHRDTNTHGDREYNYGRLAFRWPDGSRRPIHAHVASHYIHSGKLPEKGKVVMHSCDYPPCVNPAHLSVGTQKQNINDAQAKGRMPTYVERRQTAERARFSREQGAEIRRARQGAGMTIFDVADLLDVHYSLISLLENGKRSSLPKEKADALLSHLNLVMTPQVYTHFVGLRPVTKPRLKLKAAA